MVNIRGDKWEGGMSPGDGRKVGGPDGKRMDRKDRARVGIPGKVQDC